MNRLAVAAALIQAERGAGKNAAWDVEFSGATADAVDEGSDVQEAEFTTDPPQAAVLHWAHYRQSFKISETKNLQFPWETFNTFNHAQFFGPSSVNGDFDSGLFGQVVKAAPPRLMQPPASG